MATNTLNEPKARSMTHMNASTKLPFTLRAIRGMFSVTGKVSTRLSTYIAVKLFYKTRPAKYRANELAKLGTAKQEILAFRDTMELHVASWGDDDSPVIVALHGWEGKGISFLEFVDPLVAAGYKVVTVDVPGHGLSKEKEADLTYFIDSLATVAKVFGPLHGIIAHSFGGLATILALEQHIPVNQVVFISAASSPNMIIGEFGRIFNLGDKVVDGIKRNIEKRTKKPFATYVPRIDAPKPDIPVLIIHDKNDRVLPYGVSDELLKFFPKAQKITTTGLGHQKILRDPAVVQQVTKFLMH